MAQAAPQQYSPGLFSGMQWREIGPLRAGRTHVLAGVASEPNTFFIGAVNGGVWKTTDAGETWQPLFDQQPTGSIGAIAVAPSDPNTIYVGSGEGLGERPDLSTGDGMYKSIDGGKTWTHLGLRDSQQIPQVVVDPHDPNRLFVAALGHPYGPSEERGVFRSTDGGKTFKKVLYRNPATGAYDVEIDPNNGNILYAGLWEQRQGPWENGQWTGTNGGLCKSTDGGDTWTEITGHGLPAGITQVAIAIAPSNPNRVYAAVATGQDVHIMRSDDQGANWTRTTEDPRPEARIGGGDLPLPKVDPRNPDVLYICSTVTWKSTDAGKTWYGLRGAPGGDDYQNVWINPENTNIIALTSDQGAIVTVNGGDTWSQWFNQPTAQVYHVTTDNHFPYRVCGGQQDSGSACVLSRSNDGRITFHDWHPVGIEEYGYAAPDPLDPDIVFGGKVTRYDRRTGQISDIEPKPLRDYRVVRTEPLVFSPVDPHLLFFGANSVFKTTNGGQSWSEISPDLSRKDWAVPASIGSFRQDPTAQSKQRGVVYALAPSPLDVNRLWAGTDDGLIWVTADGGQHWDNVTPPALQPWWKVFNMDAGHFDALTAYAAVNTLRLDDMRPHLFRTHDGGKSWTEIDNGIPQGAATSTIREDPEQKGLLFAGSETQVYVSFDDGDHWQSLRLNMPPSSVRDLQVKGDDLVAGTHGRGFLVLDDITPLRQLAAQIGADVAASPAYLYRPQIALRIRGDMNPPTPWVPEMATGQNPPDGAILDYYLGAQTAGPVTLEILDSAGKLVNRYSSTDPVPPPDPHYPVPTYWERPPRVVSTAPGEHRFLWDMHYPPIAGVKTGPDADQAVPHNTPSVPTSPWIMPGNYTVRLTVGKQTYTQPLVVRMDPRVKTSLADLGAQFDLSKQMYNQAEQATAALHQIEALRKQLRARNATGATAAAKAAFDKQLEALAGKAEFHRGGPAGPPSFTGVRGTLLRLQHELQGSDVAPTAQLTAGCASAQKPLPGLMEQWKALQGQPLASLNTQLRQSHLAPITLQEGEGKQDTEELEDGDKDADVY
ncbi:MAG: glycoside hydrolase [Acidobacteriaceae bacterium]